MRRLLFMVFLCAAWATPAFADLYGTVSVSYKGLIRGASTLTLTDPLYGMTNEKDVGLHLLGLGALNIEGATASLPANSYLEEGLAAAFCVDLLNGFPPLNPPTKYDAVSLDVAPKPGIPPFPPGHAIGSNAKYMAQLLNTNSYATADQAAAVQVALWEIMYEAPTNGWNVTSGDGVFYLGTSTNAHGEATIAAMANSMLYGLGQAQSYSQYTTVSYAEKNAQDFVLVPVPAAVLLGMLGLGAAGVKLRKYA